MDYGIVAQMTNDGEHNDDDDSLPRFGGEPLEFEEVDGSGNFAPDPPPDDEYDERALHEEESSTRMKIDTILLGAMAVDKADKKTGTILNNLLARSVTSSMVCEEVGDLLTVDSFFDEADETQEKPGVDKVKLWEERKKKMQVALAKLLVNLAELNVARRHMKKLHK